MSSPIRTGRAVSELLVAKVDPNCQNFMKAMARQLTAAKVSNVRHASETIQQSTDLSADKPSLFQLVCDCHGAVLLQESALLLAVRAAAQRRPASAVMCACVANTQVPLFNL